MEYKCFYDVKTPCFSKKLELVADENTLLYSVFEDDPLVNNFTQVKLFENDILLYFGSSQKLAKVHNNTV